MDESIRNTTPEIEESVQFHLQYPEGWQEILESPDAADYQMWIESLVELSKDSMTKLETPPSWSDDRETIKKRWQGAIEIVAEAAIDPDDLPELSQAEIVETALLTLKENVESLEWEEEGIAFIVPNLYTGEEVRIDLRDLPEPEVT